MTDTLTARLDELYPDCLGGSDRCEGVVTMPAQTHDLAVGDLSNYPYCPPCRVAAAGDAAQDEPAQGPIRPLPELGLYRARREIGCARTASGDEVRIAGGELFTVTQTVRRATYGPHDGGVARIGTARTITVAISILRDAADPVVVDSPLF